MDDVPNIAFRAYQLWDAAGRPDGRSEDFYFKAEEELRLLLEKQLGENQLDEKQQQPGARRRSGTIWWAR